MQNRKNVTCLSVSIYISKLNLKQDNGTFEKEEKVVIPLV